MSTRLGSHWFDRAIENLPYGFVSEQGYLSLRASAEQVERAIINDLFPRLSSRFQVIVWRVDLMLEVYQITEAYDDQVETPLTDFELRVSRDAPLIGPRIRTRSVLGGHPDLSQMLRGYGPGGRF